MVALIVLAPGVSAKPTFPLHAVKDCSTYTGVVPSLCTIAKSDAAVLPVGTRVWYQGPVLTNIYFLSSVTVLDDEAGDTATGYCIYGAEASRGMCSFYAGTGKLDRFHALVDVTIDASGLWHWDGMYYFADPSDTQ